jgi:hypothetical protein
MKNTFIFFVSLLILSIVTPTYSQTKELEVSIIQISQKGKLKSNKIVEGEDFLKLDGEDDFSLESIEFRNWNDSHGLKITKKDIANEEVEELVFFSLRMSGEFKKKKNGGENILLLQSNKYDLFCYGESLYQVIDSNTKEVVREFKISQYVYGE